MVIIFDIKADRDTNIQRIHTKREQLRTSSTKRAIESALQDHLRYFTLNKMQYTKVPGQV